MLHSAAWVLPCCSARGYIRIVQFMRLQMGQTSAASLMTALADGAFDFGLRHSLARTLNFGVMAVLEFLATATWARIVAANLIPGISPGWSRRAFGDGLGAKFAAPQRSANIASIDGTARRSVGGRGSAVGRFLTLGDEFGFGRRTRSWCLRLYSQ